MPILIILGIAIVIIIISIYENTGHSKHVFSKDELEQLQKDMCGKPKDECAALLKKYRKNRLEKKYVRININTRKR